MSNEATLNWVRGLSEYLNYTKSVESKKFIDFLEQAMYAENPVVDTTNQEGMIEFISVLRKFAPDPVFDIFHKYYRLGYNPLFLQDAFSRGQVLSKIWLVNELEKINPNFNNILIYAGWMGQLLLYLKDSINFDNVRIVDCDPIACEISDKIINNNFLEGWKVKSSCINIEEIEHFKNHCIIPLTTKAGETLQTKFMPDLIINTSAEHMKESWFYNIKQDSVIAIQSNNLFDIKEHVNCVHSIEEMKKKFKMTEVLYEGELELHGYKRFMLIGKK